ncbi:IMP cyclohydrolase [Methanothermus fervidus DSM 2088]|uniref:IMP cyclohydrolase n=1 Tax=Methanothermus fervidus (strain ATCC 43054 / DSM 2088 / JCM 10308 / V24 S) TaxID=523846 RepID=E3GXU2_METFV|nr:IMP cyclohydrolase [Methanothermus fervidus]ADP77124.1 IMP cyclohydrolase [Methanothermus fervidus DSM 2088]
MYVGRFLVVGSNENGYYVAYRVSSRSFPNRVAKIFKNKISIVPKEGHEEEIFKNPYISYNCIRIVDDVAVVSNGSHTDIIAEKIESGMNMKDAMTLALLVFDYEKDEYNTPRIAGVINNKKGYIGIVTKDFIRIEKIKPMKSYYIAVYKHNVPKEVKFEAKNAKEAVDFILNKGIFKKFTHPVTAAAAFKKEKWEMYARCLNAEN